MQVILILLSQRVLVGLINKQKIRCSFESKGCPEITTVENIDNHEKYCIHNKEMCKTCGFVSSKDHECVKSLLEYKQNMSGIMDKIRKELDDSNAQNRNLRSQIDNYMRTIQDLTKERNNLNNTIQQQKTPAAGVGREYLEFCFPNLWFTVH